MRAAAAQAEQARLAQLAAQRGPGRAGPISTHSRAGGPRTTNPVSSAAAAEKVRQEAIRQENAAKARVQEQGQIEHVSREILTKTPHLQPRPFHKGSRTSRNHGAESAERPVGSSGEG